VNTAAEALGTRLAQLANAELGLRILSNLSDRRVVRARVEVPGSALVGKLALSAPEVLDGIEAASVFAERDPYRAATHNKGLMNGVDSVVLATGNDYRAIEAGAHAYAARSGRYTALATWRRRGAVLEGSLEIPLALGTVGGTLAVHDGAKLALRLAEVRGATDLALLAAAVGLASNLAAIRALSTEGIQKGHMALHARSVAVAAGAAPHEVDALAAQLVERKTIDRASAETLLSELRSK
jgi:hydroxymethylglutaryl-CoA reductase